MTETFDGSPAAQTMDSCEDDEPDQRLTFDVVTESGDWRLFEPVADHLQKISAIVTRHLELPEPRCEVCLALCSDDAVHQLNLRYRGKDSATNVLSFPSSGVGAEQADQLFLGDLAIADETLRREAEASDTPLASHFTHIVLHGVLHLLGYDHLEDVEAEEMESLEVAILSELGISDPYGRVEVLQSE